jgi:hypothetical protein
MIRVTSIPFLLRRRCSYANITRAISQTEVYAHLPQVGQIIFDVTDDWRIEYLIVTRGLLSHVK